jgi:hypothetical protein
LFSLGGFLITEGAQISKVKKLCIDIIRVELHFKRFLTSSSGHPGWKAPDSQLPKNRFYASPF